MHASNIENTSQLRKQAPIFNCWLAGPLSFVVDGWRQKLVRKASVLSFFIDWPGEQETVAVVCRPAVSCSKKRHPKTRFEILKKQQSPCL